MYHKHTNKTAVHSQHMVAQALFRLMKHKTFQQISVTEICEEAGIGRKTFYRNFDQKEDVVEFWLDILCAQYREDLFSVPQDQMLSRHCAFLKLHKETLSDLYRSSLHAMTEEKFSVFLREAMPLWSTDPVEQEYRSQYILAGIEAVIRLWFVRGFPESIDQIVAIVDRAMDRPVPLEEHK